jgi:hypothetical protein
MKQLMLFTNLICSGEIRRNRRHLVKIPESVKDNDKITSETTPDNSSKSDNENKDIPDQTDVRDVFCRNYVFVLTFSGVGRGY